MDSGLSSLLIMSVSQMGLILCKLSEGARRYERTMDFSNEGQAKQVLTVHVPEAFTCSKLWVRIRPVRRYPPRMTQIDVSLTDYGLAVECVCFTCLMARSRAGNSSLPVVFMLFFFSIAIAAAAGGTVHGFFLDESSLGYRILWPSTLVVMGVTALSGVHIATALHFSRSKAVQINRIALTAFITYFAIVLFIRRDFLIAILGYLPALVFVGVAFLLSYLRQRKLGFLIGFLGVCTMFFAAAAQQAKLGIDPRYFNHNALYHALQALALFMVFLAARAATKAEEFIN